MSNSEYQLSVVVSKHGDPEIAEENMERLAVAFLNLFPSSGAVTAADFCRNTLDVTFSVDATDAKAATDLGGEMFIAAAEAAELEPTEILDMRTTLVRSPGHDRLTDEMVLA